MKKHIIVLLMSTYIILINYLSLAQNCPEVQDKSISLQGTVNGPCAIYTARDSIAIIPGFTLKGESKLVKFIWSGGIGGYTPQLKIGDSPTCYGLALPVVYDMNDLYYSILALNTNLVTTLGATYIISMNTCGLNCTSITVESLSDFTYYGNYTSHLLIAPYIAPNRSFTARIDENLILPANYISSDEIPDLDNRQPNTDLPFGTIDGEMNVLRTGALTYEIPIEVPPGIGDLVPKLTLAYNSQAGNDILGWGFSLNGLSHITRVPQNQYSNNAITGLKYSNDDRFALDGNRLVLAHEEDVYGGDNTTYRTENESFLHIISHGTYSTNSPVWFEVYDKNGTKYKYGSQGGQTIYTNGSTSTVLIWYLDYVEDKFGNTITYNYIHDQNGLVTYLKKINYGTNKAGLGTASTVNFYYELRNDPIDVHYYSLNTQIKWVLYKVTSKTGSKNYRTYNLEYLKDSYSRLTKITENVSDGSQLNPTYLKWGDYHSDNIIQTNYSLPEDDYYDQVNFSHRKWTTGDIDGDGVTDLISYFPYTGINGFKTNIAQAFNASINSDESITFSMGNSYSFLNSTVWDNFNVYNTTYCTQNINGDSEPDIIVPVLFKSTSFNARKIQFLALNHDPSIPIIENDLLDNSEVLPPLDIGDLNNDGIADIVYSENDPVTSITNIYIHYSNSNPEWLNLPQTNWSSPIKWSGYPAMYVFIGDYNTDGLKDIMIVNDHGEYAIFQNVNGTISSGMPYNPVYSSFVNNTPGIIRIGDFNGDGLPDFVVNEKDTPNWYFAFNKGNFGFNIVSLPLINSSGQDFTDKDNTVDNCLVTDFNNDGKSDIIIFDGTYDKHCDLFSCWGTFNNFKTYWYKSTGEDVILEKTALSSNEDDSPYFYYVSGDFNSDERLDVMNFGYDCYEEADMSQKWRMYSTPNTNYEGGHIISISNGLAQNIKISYSTTGTKLNYGIDTDLTSGSPTYPLSFLGSSIYIVKRISAPNGVSSDIVHFYDYRNGIVDLQRGFIGFGQLNITNPQFNDIALMELNYEFKLTSGMNTYYQPFLTSTLTKVNNSPISEISTPLSNYYVDVIPGVSRHVFMYPTKTIQTDYLNYTIKTLTKNMDNEGNVLTSETEIADRNSPSSIVSSQKLTYNGYAKRDASLNLNPFKNAPDNVVSEQKHRDTPENTFSLTTAFNYNTNGTLLNKTDFSGTPKSLLTKYSYDEVGNLLIITAGERKSIIEYTTDKRFVKKKTDPLNHFTESEYDIWGNPLVQWDMNRLKTVYQYDAWGHLMNVTSPDGQKVSASINWFNKGDASVYGPSNTLYYTSSFDEDDHFITAEYMDAVGHSLRVADGSFNGRVLYTDATYTTKGEILSETNPYLSSGNGSKTTIFSYDNFGRVNTQTLPNGEVITTLHSDDALRQITSTYSTGEIYIKEFDASGLLTKSTGPGGIMTYTYFSNGKIKNIQPSGGAGATQVDYYSETGLQKTLLDPSSGLNTYDYNNYGEIISQIDGKLNNTTLSYDKCGRLETKIQGSKITSYTYDGSGSFGFIKSITDNQNGAMTYKYDGLCRLTEISRSLGSDAFTFRYEYDAKSRVRKIIYPNSMALTYGYNSNSGHLTSIIKDGSPIWSIGTSLSDVNDIGQITKVTFGNGISTFYGYDTQDRLNCIKADKIIDFRYQFNNKQQLEFRDEKYFNGTTFDGFKENFEFDDANRLTSATKDNGNAPLSMAYTSFVNDRIDTKSDVGKFVYEDLSKYSVDKITNLISVFPRHDLTYNLDEKVSQVTETNNGVINKVLDLNYGVDGDRFKTEFTQDGSQVYTKYYFDTYEKQVMKDGSARHLNYIYAGNTLIGIFEQRKEGDKMHFVYTDYLGSIRSITSNNGTIEQQMSFDAWGNRRDCLTGLQLTKEQTELATNLTSRGFIGQEHIDGLGLINLNARLYEPILGLFLSPDNFIQSPDNKQNFNRYSYCLNNPLSNIDQDGNFFFMPILYGMAIGALTSAVTYTAAVATSNGGFSNWHDKDFIKSVEIGALGGGITGGMMAAGSSLGVSTQSVWYQAISSTVSNSVTDLAFNGKLSGSDIFSNMAGGIVGGYLGLQASNMLFGPGVNGSYNGHIGGVIEGAISGLVGGFSSGFISSLIRNNYDMKQAIHDGIRSSAFSSIQGGIVGGIHAKMYDRNIWTGMRNTEIEESGCKYYVGGKTPENLYKNTKDVKVFYQIGGERHALQVGFGLDFNSKERWWNNIPQFVRDVDTGNLTYYPSPCIESTFPIMFVLRIVKF